MAYKVRWITMPQADFSTQPDSIGDILDRANAGKRLSEADAIALIECSDADLPPVMATAAAMRDRSKGRDVTYSPKVFLPVTNLCRDRCTYCTFRKDPGDPGAWTMTLGEIAEWSRRGRDLGCIEALMCLGDKPELAFKEYRATLASLGARSTIEYVARACETALAEGLLPHTNAGIMSRDEMTMLRPLNASMGLMLETTSTSLLDPGAAHDNAPDKIPARRLRTIEEAGRQNVPFTTGLLIGIGETPEDRVDTLLAIRDLHRRYGHIQEVIIQNFRTKPDIPMRDWPEPTQGEMLRTIAVARLLMPDGNLQAPPNLSAPFYDELLDAGVNDWGGISPLTPDFINPEKPWPHLEELKLRTEARGYSLRQRLPIYPEFLPALRTRPGLLAEKLEAVTDREGYARRSMAA